MLSSVCNLSCRAGRLSVVPMDDQSDTVHILLRRVGGQQLWLDFGVMLTAAPRGFKPRQMVDVTGTITPGLFSIVIDPGAILRPSFANAYQAAITLNNIPFQCTSS